MITFLWFFTFFMVAGGAAAVFAWPYVRDRLASKQIFARSLTYILFRVSLPRVFPKEEEAIKQKIQEKIAVMEQLYAAFAHMHEKGSWLVGPPYVALEIAVPNIGEEITFYVATHRRWASSIEKAIHALYPSAAVERVEDYNIFHPEGNHAGAIGRFQRDWALPIRTYMTLEADPLKGITNALSKLVAEGEGAAIQILLRPAKKQLAVRPRHIARQMQKAGHTFERARYEVSLLGHLASMFRGSGKQSAKQYQMAPQPREGTSEARRRAAAPYYAESFQPVTPMQQEIIKVIEGKAARPLFEVNIRVIGSGPAPEQAEEVVGHMGSAFEQFAAPNFNEFKFPRMRGRALSDLIFKFSFRIFDPAQAIILNSEELTSLFHFPNVPLETPKVHFLKAKPAPAPANLPQEGIVLGVNKFRGQDTVVRLSPEDRRRHLYVVGQTGTGKTTFLRELIRQDIVAGRGVGVIDPHGDLAEAILSLVPKSRADDVVYFDPADMERPMGLNMLEWKLSVQKDFAVQEMIAIFMKLFPPEVIGPMFEHNMRNAMLTLMADQQNPGTIVEIPRIFTDESYVKALLRKVEDPMVRAFWEKEMAKTTEFHKSEMLGYLISKVGRFVENEMMRNILGQPRSGFDLRQVMDEGKIFIANLSKGRVGEVNGSLLGLILVSKMQMAAMTRADMPEEQRKDFYLYVDEFQNFTTDSIATILSEARKYRLNMTLAHQFIAQLPDTIRESVFGNVGSLVSFRVGPKGAEFLVKQFAPVFDEQDLVNVDNFHAYIRILVRGKVERPFNIQIMPPSKGDMLLADQLRELSRQRFGRQKQTVVSEIMERSRLAAPAAPEQTFVPGERNR